MDYGKVIELVKQAGKLVFDERLKSAVSLKGDADFLTAVDTNISDYLKTNLRLLAPDVGFMSEEDNSEHFNNRWILDPVDGTTNLVYGYRMSSVSLAYIEDNTALFGVVYNPYSGELFTAQKGKGAMLNGEPLNKAPDRPLKDCIIEFGAGSTKKQFADVSFALAKKIFMNCLDIRRICSSALAICFVAAGRLNGYFEKRLKPWDYAAASLILEECGGISSDWEGSPLQYNLESSYVCGTKTAYNFMLKTIGEQTAR